MASHTVFVGAQTTEFTPPAAVSPPSGAARPRLTFLGTGYLGATYAICFAELGYDVIGFDVDEEKIAKLASGDVPFHEAGPDELLKRNLAAGRLRFSTDIAETAAFGDVHFICVGTPQRADGMSADLSSRAFPRSPCRCRRLALPFRPVCSLSARCTARVCSARLGSRSEPGSRSGPRASALVG